MILKCKRCGSENVQVQGWFNPNTKEIDPKNNYQNIISDTGDCWCCECDDNAELIMEDHKNSNKNLLIEINDWWEGSNDDERELASGLDSNKFSDNALFQAQCERVWKLKTEQQKVDIYREIKYRDEI